MKSIIKFSLTSIGRIVDSRNNLLCEGSIFFTHLNFLMFYPGQWGAHGEIEARAAFLDYDPGHHFSIFKCEAMSEEEDFYFKLGMTDVAIPMKDQL